MYLQRPVRTANGRDWSRSVAALSIVVAVLAALAWWLPLMRFAGEDYSSSDSSTILDARVLVPVALIVVTALIGLTGRRRAIGFAGGLASAYGAALLTDLAQIYEIVGDGSVFRGVESTYRIGYWLLLSAGVLGLVTAAAALVMLSREATVQARSVPALVAALGGVGVIAMFGAWLFPGIDGFQWDGSAYNNATFGFVLVGVAVGGFGFLSRRPLGAAVATGAGTFGLVLWVLHLLSEPFEFVVLLFGRSMYVMVGGALVVVICGGIAMCTKSTPLFDDVGGQSPGIDALPAYGDPWWMPVQSSPDSDAEVTVGSAMLPPSGWHPDPAGRHRLRFWDGTAWTDRVANGSQTGNDPL